MMSLLDIKAGYYGKVEKHAPGAVCVLFLEECKCLVEHAER
jgi:hypothetical protein